MKLCLTYLCEYSCLNSLRSLLCRLTIKDDEKYIWQIDIPEPNVLFSFYEATVNVYEGQNGPEASLEFDVVLLEESREKRIQIIDTVKGLLGTRIRELTNFVLERDGRHFEYNFSVERDVDEMWGIVSNWNDVSWVQGATGVVVDVGPPLARTIKFPSGETFEVLTKLSHKDKLMAYTVEKSAGMPVYVLKDTLVLSATAEEKKAGVTQVHTTIAYLPRAGLDADEIHSKLTAAFQARFQWVSKTFAKSKPQYSPDMFYGKLDVSKKIFHNATTGTIDAPVAKVWEIFRVFGRMDVWWKDFYEPGMSVSKGSLDKPEIGQVRSFETLSSTQYKEKLLVLDDSLFKMVYSLEYMNPPRLTGAVTTVDFDEDPADKSKTIVNWSSAFTLPEQFYPLAGKVSEQQKRAYDLGILGLQQHFNPYYGRPLFRVEVTAGESTKRDGDYLFLTVGKSASQRVPISRGGNVRSAEELKFIIVNRNDTLTLRLMNNRWLRDDEEVGNGQIPLKSFDGGKTNVVEVKDKRGNSVGSFVLTGSLDQSRPSKEDMINNIGTIAMRFGQELQDNIRLIAAQMSDDINSRWEYAGYGEAYGPLPKYCKVLPASQAISPFRSGQLFQRFQEYVYSQIPLAKILSDPVLAAKFENSDVYSAILRGWVPRTEKLYQDWMKDEEVCAQSIRGANPMKITCLTDKSVLPKEFKGMKDDSGRTVDQLISSKSLFYCDYHELMQGEPAEDLGCYSHVARLDIIQENLGPRKYWYAPFLVMYKSQKTGKLSILGFQLTRHRNKPNEVYSKNTHPKNVYQLAKLHLTCADNQHHQFISHLGLTHLLVEPFAMAVHNVFPVNPATGARHPIGKLLHAHFQDTIAINFLARQTLVSEFAPFTDSTFSPGTHSGMKMFAAAFQNWDFLGSNFENDLKSRGFDERCSDGLSDYYYREDGFKIWNALKTYVSSIVDELYASDDSVSADPLLQKWCTEIISEGGITTFPSKLNSKSLLVETVVSIIFYSSAQHAAVNFPQERYIMYIPNRPDSLLTPMTSPAVGEKDIPDTFLKQALPNLANSEFQALFGYLLTAPADNPFSGYSAMKEEFPKQWQVFSDELKAISSGIQARNKSLTDAGEIPYEYLDPSVIPQSINI